MDETDIISCILKGCCLARELHSTLPAAAKKPRLLAGSCDEIANIFRAAKERLDAVLQAGGGGGGDHQLMSPYPNNMYAQGSLPMETGAGSSHVEAQDWLRTTYLQALQAQFGGSLPEKNTMDHGMQLPADREAVGSGGESQDSRNAYPQRSRRRKDDVKKRRGTVAAPRIGNTDIPPDDNFTWRKYGQKEILGSNYPRSYYRCTHQKLYNCPARKQVQRLDHDPSMFDITYLDEHTCHKSATAPSVPPQPPPPSSLEMIQATGAQLPMGGWLSIDLKPTGEGGGSFVDHCQVPMKMDLGLAGEGGGGSGGGGSAAGSGAGPSMVRFGREVPEYPVVDLADTMFNTGSTSSNSMDFLFTADYKWEQHQPHGDKKN